MGSRTRDEWFGVDVAFVDREQQVFGPILGGDRETAGEVGENSIASEFGRGLDTAAENSVQEIVGVVVVQTAPNMTTSGNSLCLSPPLGLPTSSFVMN
jgi:hypothetical protein